MRHGDLDRLVSCNVLGRHPVTEQFRDSVLVFGRRSQTGLELDDMEGPPVLMRRCASSDYTLVVRWILGLGFNTYEPYRVGAVFGNAARRVAGLLYGLIAHHEVNTECRCFTGLSKRDNPVVCLQILVPGVGDADADEADFS